MSVQYDIGKILNIMDMMQDRWAAKAAVKKDFIDKDMEFDEELADFPSAMIPFWDHPDFQKHDAALRERLRSHGWVNYNNNTISAEERVVNPAFALMVDGSFEGLDVAGVRYNVMQSLIDEHYHSLMHMRINDITIQKRRLQKFRHPDSRNYQELCKTRANLGQDWEKNYFPLFGRLFLKSVSMRI